MKCKVPFNLNSVDSNAVSIDFEFLDKAGGFYYEVRW
jgi:hypothetical protein